MASAGSSNADILSQRAVMLSASRDAEIANFDWLGLWQSVDHTGPDPLRPFMTEVRENQE
jgi:hypothetical protein